MYTFENLLVFVHVLAAIVWVGGVLALSVLAVRVGHGPDRTTQASLLLLSDQYVRALIAPAGVLTLVSGIPLADEMDLSLGTFWIVWGLIGLVLSRSPCRGP